MFFFKPEILTPESVSKEQSHWLIDVKFVNSPIDRRSW